ncbi:MAG: amidohydrolase [Candidatus Latescibacteria bacterium]|nr:amidohydrolase [Candidatus Latescibacterota bacterium]
MDARETLKRKICEAIDHRRGQIERIGDHIMAHPETGFKEFETSRLAADTMEEFGISPVTGLGITGVKGILRGAKPGPTVALIGELDSLVVPDHPMADPETGAAHACGHNAQMAGLLGAMMGMVDAGAAERLAGNVVFFAVPAEEYIEVEYRMGLVREGKLEFLGGKPELVRLGHFDDVDMAAMIHTHSDANMKKAATAESCNGCMVKMIRFVGRAAHAGGAPHRGINALNAAQIALMAIHAQRETFRDNDSIRVHPIITRGGDIVNVVPAEVTMETYVRGKTNEAMLDANEKVDRAIRAGAMAVGARVEIETLPGYMPLRTDPALSEVFESNSSALFGDDEVCEVSHRSGSTDMGDLSHIMPAIHPYMSGADGVGHSADWHISDKEMGYIAPAKSLALLAVDLLYGEGEEATGVLRDFEPAMTKEEYLTFQRALFKTEVFDGAGGGKDGNTN